MIKFYYGYDQDFRNCKDAVRLSNKEVQNLVDEVVEDLQDIMKNNTENNSTFRGTGDTMVFGFSFDEDGDGKLDSMDIFVCRNYEEAEGWLNEDGYFEKMDWTKDYEAEEYDSEIARLEEKTKDELIKMIMESRHPDYNPRREV